MIAMIFEFWFDPDAPESYEDYLRMSSELRAQLTGAAGFVGVERFQSCTDPNKCVAIGFFDDERAVTAWRSHPVHRTAQALGRSRYFTDYRLRMAQVVRDYGPADRTTAPTDGDEAAFRRGGSPHA